MALFVLQKYTPMWVHLTYPFFGKVMPLNLWFQQYQPSGAGGTRSPPAMPHRLQHLPAHFIQNGRWGPGIGQTLGYWTLRSTFAK